MKITKVELLSSKEPIKLPESWSPAWNGPLAEPTTEFVFSCYKVYTDEGITGIGPVTGPADPSIAIGCDPFMVGDFWLSYMGGKRSGSLFHNAAGFEIAMWDVIGKAAGLPVYKLLGASKEKQPVYAATSRLNSKEWHADHAQRLVEEGFKAIKFRLHRLDFREDLAVIEEVRKAVGSELEILVDANQNNHHKGYPYWSRKTALKMAKALDELDVFYLEEPLPRTDLEGLADVAASVDMFIAGGEHTPAYFDFREHVLQGSYDIIQPDVIINGNCGINGVKKAGEIADYFGRLVIPHVVSGAAFAMGFAPTIQAMATVDNCPLVEYAYDPPILVPETTQAYIKEPLRINADGEIELPDKPGIGIELDEERLSARVLAG